jgi:hypothetical protein
MSTNIRTPPPGQKHHTPLEILRCSPPSRGNPLTNTPQPPFIFQQRFIHLSFYIPRRNRIHCNPLGGPFIGQTLCQLGDSTFGGCVSGHGESALEGEERGEVYNGATAICGGGQRKGKHVRSDGAAEGEYCSEVYLEDLFKGLIVVFHYSLKVYELSMK